jgi:protein involved in polysaccharide export with SLBB domain
MKSTKFRTCLNNTTHISLSVLIIFWQLIISSVDLIASDDLNQSPEAKITNQPEPAPQSQTSQQTQYPFIAGDAVSISTFPDTTSFLNGIFAIDDQGYIEFPIGEKINISTMTHDQFIQYLKLNYQNYMRSPNIVIKPMLRVMVAGGFITPGLYYVESNISFWELIRIAGGPNHEGAAMEIHWQRNGEEMIDDLTPFLEQGVSLKHMGFQSGDMVWSPSPEAETAWSFAVQYVLPFLTFATSATLLWITYQNTILLATR